MTTLFRFASVVFAGTVIPALAVVGAAQQAGTLPVKSPAVVTATATATNVLAIRRPQLSTVVSPEILPDRSVIFRVRAPNATEVTVLGEWTNGVKQMTKDAQGVWTLSVGPLEPDLYGYSFFIDGFQTLDPANSTVKPMRWARTSILDVPGKQPLVHDFQKVPHGTVHQHMAIIGLSTGGSQSLTIGLNHPELFAWVGGMSAGIVNPQETFKTTIAGVAASKSQPKLLWFACGKDDFLLKQNKQLDEFLTARGIQHEFKLTEGNHSWTVWRRHFADFLPRVFRSE